MAYDVDTPQDWRLEFCPRAAALAADRTGAALPGFALVLPAVLLLTLGVFDFAYLMFEQDRATEATRRGLRVAAMGVNADLSTLAAAPVACTSTGGSVTCGGGVGSDVILPPS
ncbi:MAG: TadE/TadG family type IV pilus assembly protein [Alphaproteobacteria bacterium]